MIVIVTLYEMLPADTRDAILCEAAAFNTMLEGMDDSAAMLWEKAAELRRAAKADPHQSPAKKAANGRTSS